MSEYAPYLDDSPSSRKQSTQQSSQSSTKNFFPSRSITPSGISYGKIIDFDKLIIHKYTGSKYEEKVVKQRPVSSNKRSVTINSLQDIPSSISYGKFPRVTQKTEGEEKDAKNFSNITGRSSRSIRKNISQTPNQSPERIVIKLKNVIEKIDFDNFEEFAGYYSKIRKPVPKEKIIREAGKLCEKLLTEKDEKIQILENNLEYYTNKCSKLMLKNEELEKEKKNKETELKGKNKDLDNRSQNSEELLRKNKELEQEINILKKENQAVFQELEYKTKDLILSKQNASKREEELRNEQSRNSNNQKMLTELQDQLEEKNKKINDLLSKNILLQESIGKITIEKSDEIFKLKNEKNKIFTFAKQLDQDYKKLLEKCNEQRENIQNLENRLENIKSQFNQQRDQYINNSIIPKIKIAKSPEEKILAYQELNQNPPIEESFIESANSMNQYKDEIAESQFFTRREHGLVILESMCSSIKTKFCINDNINYTQDASDLMKNRIIETPEKAFDKEENEEEQKETILKAIAESTKRDTSNFLVSIEKIGNKRRYSFLDKSDPYLIRNNGTIEASISIDIKKNLASKFKAKGLKPQDFEVYEEGFLKYLQVNTKLHFKKMKNYETDLNPFCKEKNSDQVKHIRPIGYNCHKYEGNFESPEEKQAIKSWHKAFYSPITDEEKRKDFQAHISQTLSRGESKEENTISKSNSTNGFFEFFQYAQEAEKMALPLLFEHKNVKFYYIVLYMVRIDPQFSTKSRIRKPFCSSNYHQSLQIKDYKHAKNIAMLIKKVEKDYKMDHDNCLLCKHLNLNGKP